MKNLVLAFLCLLPFTASASEDYVPRCAVWGQIELLTTRASNLVTGHFGNDSVTLTRYQSLIYGNYKGYDVSLNVGPRSVEGTVGDQRISLTFVGGVARGFELCIDDAQE
jgi:hypothetical protein